MLSFFASLYQTGYCHFNILCGLIFSSCYKKLQLDVFELGVPNIFFAAAMETSPPSVDLSLGTVDLFLSQCYFTSCFTFCSMLHLGKWIMSWVIFVRMIELRNSIEMEPFIRFVSLPSNPFVVQGLKLVFFVRFAWAKILRYGEVFHPWFELSYISITKFLTYRLFSNQCEISSM